MLLKLYHTQFMLNPNLIDPEFFAVQSGHFETRMRLCDLDERVWAHEFVQDKQAEVAVVLTGGRDEWQRLYLDLSVSGSLALRCQRCMEPVTFELEESARIFLYADENSLDEAMMADDELDGMVIQKNLSVCELVEDQILMALPLSPRHEQCENAAEEVVNQDSTHPFAVLAGLKRNQ